MTSMVSRTCLLIGSLKIPTISKQTLKCLEKNVKRFRSLSLFLHAALPSGESFTKTPKTKQNSKVPKNNPEKSRKKLKS